MDRPVQLTPRLETAARLVPPGARLADVGTDHALLPVWLLQRGRIERAIASDLRRGPLDRARETVERYGMADRVDLRLCDGLAGIRPEEADTVVLAGMGGLTIAGILEAAPWTADGVHTLILQPMSARPDLLRWLPEHGYRLEEQRLAREGDRLYAVLTVRGGAMAPLEDWACLTGPVCPEDPEWGAYAEDQVRRLRRRMAGLAHAADPAVRADRERLAALCAQLELRIKEWLQWQR